MAWKQALSKTMQELRIHVCQTGAGSKGARDFVIGSYADLKKANPDFPILVRERSGVEAKLTARYDFGIEKSVSIQGLEAKEVAGKVQELILAGEKLPRSGE